MSTPTVNTRKWMMEQEQTVEERGKSDAWVAPNDVVLARASSSTGIVTLTRRGLRELISEAFQGVTLPATSPTVKQAMALDDNHAMMPPAPSDNRTDWTTVADAVFEFRGVHHTLRRLLIDGETAYPFCFFDAGATLFYLPIAMLIALEEYENVEHAGDGSAFEVGFFACQMLRPAFSSGRLDLLSEPQQHAVVSFVEHALRIEQRERTRPEKAYGDLQRRNNAWDAEISDVSNLADELRGHFGMLPRPGVEDRLPSPTMFASGMFDQEGDDS